MDVEAFTTATGFDRKDIADLFSKIRNGGRGRFIGTESRDAIIKVIDWAKQGIDGENDSNLLLTEYLINLGIILWDRYEGIGEIEDLEEAIRAARQAIKLTPGDHPDTVRRLSGLRSMLVSRYKRIGEIEDLEEAIEIVRRAIELTPGDHPDMPGRLKSLGVLLMVRHEKIGDMKGLQEAIDAARKVIALTPDSHPDMPERLGSLGNMLQSRYERIGKTEDLQEAIKAAREAVKMTPGDHPDMAERLESLGSMLHSRHGRTGKVEDLQEAIDIAREATKSTPDGHPHMACGFNSLGVSLVRRYETIGETEDLEEAIKAAREAIKSTLGDHPGMPDRLSNLGSMLGRRYERMGKTEDLQEAIELATQAVKLTPDDHPGLAGRLNNLGSVLQSRYERIGKTEDLQVAIEVARQAAKPTPGSHQNLAILLNNLGVFLGSRYERMGEMEDLQEAIEVAREAVKSTPDDHPGLTSWLNNLGSVLQSRYERTGEMEDLEEAIKASRRAIEMTPDDQPYMPNMLSNLGNKLGRRYERTGEMGDLQEAIEVARRAIKMTPGDHPGLASLSSNLGDKLGSRYQRTGEMEDLQEAIVLAREAVRLIPGDHPDMASLSSNLGIKLRSRYQRTGEMEDLQEAIVLAREAVRLTPGDHPDMAGRLNNLGNKLVSRYERTGEIKDLQEALEAARQAVKLTPDDHPSLAGLLSNLGDMLSLRYKLTEEMRDLEEASAYLLKAWSCLNAVPFHRVQAAAKCLQLLATQNKVDEGIDLGIRILDLLPSVHTRALDRSDQQFVVSTFAGVASNLCSFLLSANRLREALECLEQGRAIIISQMLDDRSDLSSLRQHHSHIANRYQSLVEEMNVPIRQTTPGAVGSLLRKRRQEAAAELDICLKEIRCISGYERFILRQTVAEMQECITEGFIVVINITKLRSDAFILSSNSLSLRVMVLPDLSESTARVWVGVDWSTRKKSEHWRKNDLFLKYLSWLWDVCVKHISAEISALWTHANGDLPRVWWIGSGLASSMPFHAAGVHTRGSKENAYYRMISSYTPSIKAFGYAQKQANRSQEALVAQDANIMLIAAMPTSPKGPGNTKAPKNLPGVEEEIREILNSTHLQKSATVLMHPSVDQVLEVLKTCRIAHFACHGTSDHSNPSNSGLILQRSTGPGEIPIQDRLTVQRVSDLRLKYAQIAYLSACSTAENKAAQLSDEVIHVVSGFHVAGFPHVVGCLWPAGDSECVEVAKQFYSLVLQQNQSVINNKVASALHEAVMAVRARDLSMPLNWAQFVHYGI